MPRCLLSLYWGATHYGTEDDTYWDEFITNQVNAAIDAAGSATLNAAVASLDPFVDNLVGNRVGEAIERVEAAGVDNYKTMLTWSTTNSQPTELSLCSDPRYNAIRYCRDLFPTVPIVDSVIGFVGRMQVIEAKLDAMSFPARLGGRNVHTAFNKITLSLAILGKMEVELDGTCAGDANLTRIEEHRVEVRSYIIFKVITKLLAKPNFVNHLDGYILSLFDFTCFLNTDWTDMINNIKNGLTTSTEQAEYVWHARYKGIYDRANTLYNGLNTVPSSELSDVNRRLKSVLLRDMTILKYLFRAVTVVRLYSIMGKDGSSVDEILRLVISVVREESQQFDKEGCSV